MDRIYISDQLCNKIKSIKHISFAKSDHKTCSLTVLTEHLKWGSGYWKLNESLLENEKYVKLIKNFWSSWQTRKREFEILEWWDIGKDKIKGITINFSKMLASRDRDKYNTFIQKLEEEEQKTNPSIDVIND